MYITRVVCAEERYVIVTVGNMLLINVYLPCVGTVDRQFIYDAEFCNLISWIDNYPDHMLILGGDLNVDIVAKLPEPGDGMRGVRHECVTKPWRPSFDSNCHPERT